MKLRYAFSSLFNFFYLAYLIFYFFLFSFCFQNTSEYRAFVKYIRDKINNGLIDKGYIRHIKLKIKDQGELTQESQKYIAIVNNELVLKFDEENLEPEQIDKSIEITNWSFSLEELKHIFALDLMKFSNDDDLNNGNDYARL